MLHWWQQEAPSIAAHLGVHPEQGLSGSEAAKRLRVGANELVQAEAVSPLKVLITQFKDFMVMVLISAAAVSWILGERVDAVTILAIVLLNTILGFFQEYRAERSLQALRSLAAPQARVRRDGIPCLIPAQKVVTGDLLLLEAGDRVSADARLIKAAALATGEAALTGESLPVTKSCRPLAKADLAIGDRGNMVFAGTIVVAGRGEAVVVATGMQTELGQIAGLIEEADPGPTPLQMRLAQVGRWIVLACLFICAAVGAMGVIRGESIRTMFLAAVSLAVAAIPEGLPAVVTMSLALGVQRMIKRSAIVRRLAAVETLGCATVICADKTGTITRNEMTVTQISAGGTSYKLTGLGYVPIGVLRGPSGAVAPLRAWPDSLAAAQPLPVLMLAAASCNNALLIQDSGGDWRIEGDPTEGALLVMAAKSGLSLKALGESWRRLGEIPFSSERKKMSVVCGGPDRRSYLFSKGGVDQLIGLCTQALRTDGIKPLDHASRSVYQSQADALSAKGHRLLGLACRPLTAAEQTSDRFAEDLEKDLIFLGFVAMIDPPRAETAHAIRACHRAGIKTVMITGDHPLTAKAVGQEIGLMSGDIKVMTGVELDRLSDRQLADEIDRIGIYARVSPGHKLRIVRALKAKGHRVAMTGDGVNDAPAIKEADIGVAMGKTGTDVSKEAASLVILDDNFATIVAAVEEGRAIYDNIRKFIRYLLGCNTGEVLTMFLGMLLGLPLPLLPLQILWVNLITDGLPALALGLDPPEKDLMEQAPRSPREGIFARGLWVRILWQGVAIGLCSLVAFGLALVLFRGELARARTVAFTVLVFSQLAFAIICHSEKPLLQAIRSVKNPYLLLTIGLSGLLQLAVIYLPALARPFGTVALTVQDWLIVAGLTLWSTILGEVYHPTRRMVKRMAPSAYAR